MIFVKRTFINEAMMYWSNNVLKQWCTGKDYTVIKVTKHIQSTTMYNYKKYVNLVNVNVNWDNLIEINCI